MWHIVSSASLLPFVILLPSWADENRGSQPTPSLADDLKELTGGKHHWVGKPVKIKRELTGKEEQVTPALSFLLSKGAKLGDELVVCIGVDDNGVMVGQLSTFKLTEEGSKRFIVIGEGAKQIRLSYTLKGGPMKIASDTNVKLRGDGEVDFSGEWTRKEGPAELASIDIRDIQGCQAEPLYGLFCQ